MIVPVETAFRWRSRGRSVMNTRLLKHGLHWIDIYGQGFRITREGELKADGEVGD